MKKKQTHTTQSVHRWKLGNWGNMLREKIWIEKTTIYLYMIFETKISPTHYYRDTWLLRNLTCIWLCRPLIAQNFLRLFWSKLSKKEKCKTVTQKSKKNTFQCVSINVKVLVLNAVYTLKSWSPPGGKYDFCNFVKIWLEIIKCP